MKQGSKYRLELGWTPEEEEVLNTALRLNQDGLPEYFLTEALHLIYQHTNADMIILGLLTPDGESIVSVLLLYKGEWAAQGIQYSLANSPCNQALNHEVCYYPYGIQTTFPLDKDLADYGFESYLGASLVGKEHEPIGLVALLHHKEISNPRLMEFVITILSPRLELELQLLSNCRPPHEID